MNILNLLIVSEPGRDGVFSIVDSIIRQIHSRHPEIRIDFAYSIPGALLVLLAMLVLMPMASAATRTWTGGGGTGNWGTGNNWGGINNAPNGADDLVFAGTTQLNTTNNLSGTALSETGFLFQTTAGAFTLNGTAMTLTSYITNNSANIQTINLGVIMGAALTIAANSNDIVMNGVLSGGFGFTKTGNNALIFANTNTYTGTTTISGGSIQLTSNGTTNGTLGTNNVVNNGQLVFNRANSYSVSNAISGTGTLIQQGTGTTVLVGSNSYSGGTVLNAGTMALQTNTAIGTGAVTFASNSTTLQVLSLIHI